MSENYKAVEAGSNEISGGASAGEQYNTTCSEMTYITLGDKVDYSDGMFSFMMYNNNRTIPAIPLIMTVKSVGGVNVTDKVLPLYR
jgi:hypothetical protein